MSAQGEVGVCSDCGRHFGGPDGCSAHERNADAYGWTEDCRRVTIERLQSALWEAREEVEALKAKAYAPAAQSLAENQGRAEGPNALAGRAAKLEAALTGWLANDCEPKKCVHPWHAKARAALAAEQGNAPKGARGEE